MAVEKWKLIDQFGHTLEVGDYGLMQFLWAKKHNSNPKYAIKPSTFKVTKYKPRKERPNNFSKKSR